MQYLAFSWDYVKVTNTEKCSSLSNSSTVLGLSKLQVGGLSCTLLLQLLVKMEQGSLKCSVSSDTNTLSIFDVFPEFIQLARLNILSSGCYFLLSQYRIFSAVLPLLLAWPMTFS